MPKIKKKRIPIKIDMTPMVDVSLLLLTFFMMTTQFKPPAAVQITLPTSDQGPKLPETGVLTITVDTAGTIFMGVDQQQIMKNVFEPMFPNGVQTEDGKVVPVWLASAVPVKADQLAQLVVQARIQNVRMITVIKADKDADYGPVMDVMNALQKANVTRFDLQTELRAGKGKEGG